MNTGQPSFREHASLKLALRGPAFLCCSLALLGTGIALRPAMNRLADHYRKESVPLRRPLQRFDVTKLPSFELVPDAAGPKAGVDALGTDQFCFLTLREKGCRDSADRAILFVSYYSDPEDRVPHTPEVCYRQTDTTVATLTTVTIETPALAPEYPRVEARFLDLVQPSASGALIYLFYANGRFCYDREQVRWIVNKPGDRYIYFSKIEVAVARDGTLDAEAATDRCKKLLREALPVLIADHYPDKTALK
jgi:hypothetical protein